MDNIADKNLLTNPQKLIEKIKIISRDSSSESTRNQALADANQLVCTELTVIEIKELEAIEGIPTSSLDRVFLALDTIKLTVEYLKELKNWLDRLGEFEQFEKKMRNHYSYNL